MNGMILFQGLIRGLHDVFSAVWAGGLITMAITVIPVMKSIRTAGPVRFMSVLQKRLRAVVTVAIIGVFATGFLLLRLTVLPSGGLDPKSLYGRLLIVKIAISVVMLGIAIVRAGMLRKLGDDPGDPRKSGIPLLFSNAALAVVVLLLSGVAGALG